MDPDDPHGSEVGRDRPGWTPLGPVPPTEWSGIVAGREPDGFSRRPFRFLFFFSREEERLHIHVQSPDGEAKFWIEPRIELARNHQLSEQDLRRVLQLVVDHEQEIRDAWQRHFGR